MTSRMSSLKVPLTHFQNVNIGIMVSNLSQGPNPPLVKFIPCLQTNKRSSTSFLKSTWHLGRFVLRNLLWLHPSSSLKRRMGSYALFRTIRTQSNNDQKY